LAVKTSFGAIQEGKNLTFASKIAEGGGIFHRSALQKQEVCAFFELPNPLAVL